MENRSGETGSACGGGEQPEERGEIVDEGDHAVMEAGISAGRVGVDHLGVGGVVVGPGRVESQYCILL